MEVDGTSYALEKRERNGMRYNEKLCVVHGIRFVQATVIFLRFSLLLQREMR